MKRKTAKGRESLAGCRCHAEVNKALPEGLELDLAFSLGGAVYPKLAMLGRGSKKSILVPSFCPFCGEQYGTQTGPRFYP